MKQFKVSCVTEAEAEKRRVDRARYPDNALNHPKRLVEMPVNRSLDDVEAWNHSTQVQPHTSTALAIAAAAVVVAVAVLVVVVVVVV